MGSGKYLDIPSSSLIFHNAKHSQRQYMGTGGFLKNELTNVYWGVFLEADASSALKAVYSVIELCCSGFCGLFWTKAAIASAGTQPRQRNSSSAYSGHIGNL